MTIKQNDEQADQDRRDERERARTYRLSLAEIRELLSNTAGLSRLRAISDEDWARAAAEDEVAAP